MFREDGVDSPLHEGISFRIEERGQKDVQLWSRIQRPSRVRMVLGIVETRDESTYWGWHVCAESVPHELMDVLRLVGWGTASRCWFLGGDACYCIRVQDEMPRPIAEQLDWVIGTLRDAAPLYEAYMTFAQAHNAVLPLPPSLFTALMPPTKR